MVTGGDAHDEPVGVQRLIAHVDLEASREDFLERTRRREEAPDGELYQRFARFPSDHLRLHVSLAAELSDGRCIRTLHPDFAIANPRRGLGAIWHSYHGPPVAADRDEQREILDRTYHVGLPDIEDAINQMLGRDAEQHSPPRLAWGNLIKVLANAGVVVSEHALIDAPFTVELSADVQAELHEQ